MVKSVYLLLCLLCVCVVCDAQTRDVVFFQDASLDALTSYLLIQREDHLGTSNFLGEVMINADGVAPANMIVGGKMHTIANYSHTPLTLSRARGYNAFPYEYRKDVLRIIDATERFPTSVQEPYKNGDQWLLSVLREATSPIDIITVTGISNLALVLQEYPELVGKINSMTWMAGAVNDPGNLDKNMIPYEKYSKYVSWNPYAEWNVFFDPFAVSWIFENTKFPIYLAPLDLSNKAPLTPAFFTELAEYNHTDVGNVINAMYNGVKEEPFYRLWNTAAVATYYYPDWFKPCNVTKLTSVTTYHNMGRLGTPENEPSATTFRDVCVYSEFAPGGVELLYSWIATLGKEGAFARN